MHDYDYLDFISNLGYSISKCLTSYVHIQYDFFIAQITNPKSPGRISIGFGILVLILIQLGGQIYKYINRK